MAKLISFGLLFAGVRALAETFSNEVLTLEIPVGFKEASTASPEPGAKVVAYTKQHADIDGATLFQISTYDFGPNLEDMPEEERGNVSEYYLGQYLGGVERKRIGFNASDPEPIRLGGIPASRVFWTGYLKGMPMSGAMYCVVIGTTVVTLHTQDFDIARSENLRTAMDAFEALRVKDGN